LKIVGVVVNDENDDGARVKLTFNSEFPLIY